VTPATLGPDSRGRPFDAVVWDYDGTLVDTRSTDHAVVANLVARDPEAAAGVELFWSTEGRPIVERIEQAWPGRRDQLLPLFDGGEPPRIFPGIRPVLRELRRREMPLAVVSSRRLGPLLRGLASSRLRPNFEVVVGLDTVHAPKPDPEGLLLALERMGVTPSRAVVVGDRDVDLEAARRAGATGWRAAWALGALPPSERLAVDLPRPAAVLERLDGPAAAAG
jgi:pyrophosphatase PpaX